MLIHGIDFTSAPGRRKGITVASGTLSGRPGERRLAVEGIVTLEGWPQFEAWLRSPGPWIGGFDFPFSLPREAVVDLGWPQQWELLVRHCAALGRVRLRELLDAYRENRPVGDKYPHRRGDRAAGSHSPVKLVNPPVALMFLEGAQRLAAAGVHVPGLREGDPMRVALEAYPGFAVRQLSGGGRPGSYKNDARIKQTPEQRGLRRRIVKQLERKGCPAASACAQAGRCSGLWSTTARATGSTRCSARCRRRKPGPCARRISACRRKPIRWKVGSPRCPLLRQSRIGA